MVRTQTLRGRAIAMLMAVTVTAGVLIGQVGVGPAEAASTTPIMQKSRLTPAQIAGWFKAKSPGGYRASVPVEFLAAYFVFEGDAEGLSGDIAFAQSILETAWFRFPSTGQVTPSHNNFGGMGACDGGTCTVARFRSARIGVRAQIQHLRAYADKTVTVSNLAYPLESPRFQYVTPKGRVTYWEEMGGKDPRYNNTVNWASDPDYGKKILTLYASMRAFANANPHLKGTWLFSDVKADSTFEADIIRLAIEDITRGCSGNRYCPKQVVTRDQMASFLVRARGLKSSTTNRFTDVPSSNPHRGDINALAAAGITMGCNPPKNDRFCPKDPVSRDQMASFIVRARKLSPVGGSLFKDVPSSNVHRQDINALAKANVTRGCNPPTNDRFCPKDLVTREQMAAFLNRAFL